MSDTELFETQHIYISEGTLVGKKHEFMKLTKIGIRWIKKKRREKKTTREGESKKFEYFLEYEFTIEENAPETINSRKRRPIRGFFSARGLFFTPLPEVHVWILSQLFPSYQKRAETFSFVSPLSRDETREKFVQLKISFTLHRTIFSLFELNFFLVFFFAVTGVIDDQQFF